MPTLSDPTQVGPCDRRSGQGRCDINEWHRLLSRNDNVGKPGQATVAQKTDQPPRMPQEFWQEWSLRQQSGADKFLHPITQIALTDSRNRGVNGDDQGGESRDSSSFDRSLGCLATAHQI